MEAEVPNQIVRELGCGACVVMSSPPPMESNMRSTINVMLIMLTSLAPFATHAEDRSRAGPAWQTYSLPQFGTTVQYPAGIFSFVEGKAEKGVGQRFGS